jgi:hypothetical protein
MIKEKKKEETVQEKGKKMKEIRVLEGKMCSKREQIWAKWVFGKQILAFCARGENIILKGGWRHVKPKCAVNLCNIF